MWIKMSSVTMLAQLQVRVDLIWPWHCADMVAWDSFLPVLLVRLCTVNCCVAWTCWMWVFSARWSSSSFGDTCADRICFKSVSFRISKLVNPSFSLLLTEPANNSWSPACISQSYCLDVLQECDMLPFVFLASSMLVGA